MEVNNKVAPFPFQRHINYKNYMRKNKRLSMLTRKTKEDGCEGSIVYVTFKKK